MRKANISISLPLYPWNPEQYSRNKFKYRDTSSLYIAMLFMLTKCIYICSLTSRFHLLDFFLFLLRDNFVF